MTRIGTRQIAVFTVFVLVVLLGGWPGALRAHTIPNDLTVQAFVKAEGNRLRLLVRTPLAKLPEVEWPLKAPGILNSSQAAPVLAGAAVRSLGKAVTMFEGDRPLTAPQLIAVRATQADDKSFEGYAQALRLVSGPPDAGDIAIASGFLDALFEYPIQSETSRFSIEPRWYQMGSRPLTVVRLQLPNGAVRAFELAGNPGFVQLDPAWEQAAARFIKLGFEHILSGTDHLLFLFALVIPFRRFRQLVVVVTAFTVAHSITLIASAYDLAPSFGWFPPLIETLIAASIVYMTLENIVGANLKRRWMITFGFGLVHGFGFSFALKETLQFAGAHLLTSLLSFNIGVELGQLLVLALLIPALDLTFRYVKEQIGIVFLSALVAHTGWHWLLERAGVLRRYPFSWPALTPALLATVLRGAFVLAAVGATLWGISALTKSRTRTEP